MQGRGKLFDVSRDAPDAPGKPQLDSLPITRLSTVAASCRATYSKTKTPQGSRQGSHARDPGQSPGHEGRFESKVVLITGGTSGLGRDAALAFSREGAKIVLTGRRVDAGEGVVSAIRKQGGNARFIRTDVSRPADVEASVKACVETYGELHCAFNNAGIDGTLMTPLIDYQKDVWDEVIATNLTGTFLCMKYEIPEMLKCGGGCIVNMSAMAGLRSGRRTGAAYNASKHGIIGLTTTAAVEYAPWGIRVNAVCPALIHTPMSEATFLKNEDMVQKALSMYPVGRIGRPEEVTSLVLWLCSREASFVTGAAIPVDGGALLI
jgi:NAD(P)-dependent dehydrogenase (short-subunit alcohol dehydrogenase family)